MNLLRRRYLQQFAVVAIFTIATLFSLVLRAQAPAKSPTVSNLPPHSERWALVIGINKYDDGNLNPLFGQNDAKRIASDLEQYAGFPGDQVFLLTDDQDRDHQPTRERILYWLSILKQDASPNGLILIAFSGHGLRYEDKSFLMPKDAHLNFDSTYLTQTAIAVDVLTDILRKSHAKQVIVLMDSCRNNPFANEGSETNKMSSQFVASFDYEKQNLGKEAYATIFSTGLGGESYQFQDEKMGYFSWVLDQALSGAAREAYDTNGQLTLGGLIRFLQKRTPELVKLHNPWREQVPHAQVDGYLADQVVLAVSTKQADKSSNDQTDRTIDSLRQHAEELMSKQNYTEAMALFQKGCHDDDQESCVSLGLIYIMGSGGVHDEQTGLELFSRACERGYGSGCTNLGHIDELQGASLMALKHFIRGCDSGDGSGCTNAGIYYRSGDTVNKDLGKARQYFERACRLGDVHGGCELLKRLDGQ